MSMMVSFVLSFFPRDVLDEILNLIESVSEDFLTTLTLTVCLRNARTTYFFFRNDYLQPFQEGLKEEKEEKKTRSNQKKKLSHQAHDVKITSY